MSKVYDISLVMDKKNVVKTDIVLCQGDYGMAFKIAITDHDLENVTPKIVFRKTDNKVVEGIPTKASGILSYEIKGNELSSPGMTYADVKLYDENGRESSATFAFKVVGDTLNATPTKSDSYSESLDNAINQALEAAQEARDAAEHGGGGGKGDDGTTFTPNVDTEGNLSWTNDKGLANPPPVNIKGDSADPTMLITPSTDTTSTNKVWSAKDVNEKFTQLNTDLEDLGLPMVFFDGDITGMTKDVSKILQVEYMSNQLNFKGYVEMKWQGTSSIAYPKKNFAIKIYKDSGKVEKNKVDVCWGKQNKYCLKANYIDHSHARNIVSAKLWSEIVDSRDSFNELPELYKASPNNGAIDGYPIKLYLNGGYQGIYSWNIPKDAWMFNMDDALDEHCVLCGENYVSGCFRAPAVLDGTDWSDEVHDIVPTSIKTRWNEVISFIMTSTNAQFKVNLNNYIDVKSLIDYYIFAYFSSGIDSMGKNQLYATYDGQKWYASMYDMDSTWGLYWNGTVFISAVRKCQEEYESGINAGGNLLFIRLSELFKDEIKQRYIVLRNGVLSLSNVISKFEKFVRLIPSDIYSEDGDIFTGIPLLTTNNIKQIRKYAKDRSVYVDSMINRTLTNITATKVKTTYLLGETLSLADISVVASYDTTTSNPVTTYVVDASNVSMSVADNYNIIVSYTEGGITKTSIIAIVVQSSVATLSSISATKATTTYAKDATVSITDIIASATFSDGTVLPITDYTTNVSSIEMSTVGSKTLIVSYTYKGVTKTASIILTVAEDVDSYILPSNYNTKAGVFDDGVSRLYKDAMPYYVVFYNEIGSPNPWPKASDTNKKVYLLMSSAPFSAHVNSGTYEKGREYYDSYAELDGQRVSALAVGSCAVDKNVQLEDLLNWGNKLGISIYADSTVIGGNYSIPNVYTCPNPYIPE